MENIRKLLKQFKQTRLHKANERIDGLIHELRNEVKIITRHNFKVVSPNDFKDIGLAISLIKSFQETEYRWVPRPLLVSQPKSGTKHIESFYQKLYGYKRITPVSTFSDISQLPDHIAKCTLIESDFLYGQSFLSYHLRPGDRMISFINDFKLDLIVSLRNPIQSLVSHYHYLIKNKFTSEETKSPGDYYGPSSIKNEDDLRRFLINIVYPKVLSFINEWFRCFASTDFEGRLSLISHEMLVKEPDKYHYKLASSIGVENNERWKQYQELTNHNFRSGKIHEWKDFFSDEEKHKMLVQLNKLLSDFPVLFTLFYLDD